MTCCFLVPCIVDLYGSFLYYFITGHYAELEKEILKSLAQDCFFLQKVCILKNTIWPLILKALYYKSNATFAYFYDAIKLQDK